MRGQGGVGVESARTTSPTPSRRVWCTARRFVITRILEKRAFLVTRSTADYWQTVCSTGMVDSDHWVVSSDRKSAVFIWSASGIAISEHGAGVGFPWVRIEHLIIYSCYFSLNCTIQEFGLFLGGSKESIRHLSGAPTNLVLVGDFNSHSSEYG